MRIGVVTTSYPRFDGDPAGGFVAGHVVAMRALGHSVEVIAAGDGGQLDRVTSSLFYRGGAPDLLERAPLSTAAAATSFTARLAARVLVRAARWDAIVAHWLVPSALAALPSRIPVLAIAHGGDVHTLQRMHLLAPMLHALHARGARLAFVSDDLRGLARTAAPRLARWLDTAIVQPMGIALERFAAIPRTPSTPATIAAASRLVALKGIDTLIAAMGHVRTPARLVIAGDGPERAALARSAAASSSLRAPRSIELVGMLRPNDRDALLARASVVVVPSRVMPGGRTEGTPTIALEALAAGVPVVASAVGGLRELPRLALVPPDDPRTLATAIDDVLAAPPPEHDLRAAVASLGWSDVSARLLAHLAR